jgi:hypothetical protein
VRHSSRQPEHTLVLRRQLHTYPLSESWRIAADINGNIIDLATYHPNQFALGLIYLVMQAPQHVALRAGVIVLDEMRVNAYVAHLSFIEAFQKKAPVITKDHRLDDQYSWNLRLLNVHEVAPPYGSRWNEAIELSGLIILKKVDAGFLRAIRASRGKTRQRTI